MKVIVIDKYGSKGSAVVMNISFLRWIELKVAGHCFCKYLKLEGWTDSMPFFIVKCPTCHYLFLTREHGDHNLLMSCPVCKS